MGKPFLPHWNKCLAETLTSLKHLSGAPSSVDQCVQPVVQPIGQIQCNTTPQFYFCKTDITTWKAYHSTVLLLIYPTDLYRAMLQTFASSWKSLAKACWVMRNRYNCPGHRLVQLGWTDCSAAWNGDDFLFCSGRTFGDQWCRQCLPRWTWCKVASHVDGFTVTGGVAYL